MMNQGWECPKCHIVHSPDVKRCVECSPPPVVGKAPVTIPTTILLLKPGMVIPPLTAPFPITCDGLLTPGTTNVQVWS